MNTQEMERMIAAELASLVRADTARAEQVRKSEAAIAAFKAAVEDILSVAPGFSNASYFSTGAVIEIGPQTKPRSEAEIRWEVCVEFRGEAQELVLKDERPRRWDEYNYRDPNWRFATVAELVRYVAVEFAKYVAAQRHHARRLICGQD